MTCVSSSTKDGVNASARVCMCTEGFGNRMCSLENASVKDVPPDISICMFFIHNALSVRALQEMMSAEGELVSGPVVWQPPRRCPAAAAATKRSSTGTRCS